MTNCKSCKHAIFDLVWGEYKCAKRQIRIYTLYGVCMFYEKGEPTESKGKDELNDESRTDVV